MESLLRIHFMQQRFFGMKAHIGMDAASRLVHTLRGTAYVVKANRLLHRQETDVFAYAGYEGAHKRPNAKEDVKLHVAMQPSLRRLLDKKTNPLEVLTEQVECVNTSVRAKAKLPFRVIQRQFGHVKVRYHGLPKNTAQLRMLFPLTNLWMMRKRLNRSQACM